MHSARITKAQLGGAVDYLNKITGHKKEAWSDKRTENGSLIANPGTYVLDGANGRTGLDQICSDGQGVNIIFYKTTKRDLLEKVNAFIRGIEIGREL